MIRPLKSGDTIAIVATAKRLERDIHQGILILESWGLKVIVMDSVKSHSEYFAGGDELRISDLQRALDDTNIHAILMARGGYGTTRILDLLDFSNFNKNPKWLCGFSDLTSLLLQFAESRTPAIHGPMAYTLGKDHSSDEVLKSILFGKREFHLDSSEVLIKNTGEVESHITGGNLSLVYESIGANNEIDTKGKILFLEEVGEELYAIDRMLNKLKRVGQLEELSGVILGDFTNINDSSGYFNRSVIELILSYFENVNGPIIYGFPSGHETKNYSIVFNQITKLIVGEREIQFNYL